MEVTIRYAQERQCLNILPRLWKDKSNHRLKAGLKGLIGAMETGKENRATLQVTGDGSLNSGSKPEESKRGA